jgi:type IV pilus assembly protein PilM
MEDRLMDADGLIGLDIGTNCIRAVQSAAGRDPKAAVRSGLVALPPGAVSGGVINDDKAVTAALKQLWMAERFRGRVVTLGVNNPKVVVREMSVTNLPGRELRRSLPFQVRDKLPLPVEQSLLDFLPLEDRAAATESLRGLLIAAPKDAVLTAVRAVEAAGLRVARVDLAAFALIRSVSRMDGQAEAIVDVGATVTTLVVHVDGVPLMLRTLPFGGNEITGSIASQLAVEPAEAERIKCGRGLRPGDGPDVAPVVLRAIRPMINEIRSSFAYLDSAERSARVARLTLSGGGSMLPGLPEALAAQLGIEVGLADPTARFRGTARGAAEKVDVGGPHRLSALDAVAGGLSLPPGTSEQRDRAWRIPSLAADLLPDEVVEARRAGRARTRVLAAVGAFTVLVGAWYGVARVQTSDAQDALDATTAQAQDLQRQQHAYAGLIGTQASIAAVHGQLKGLMADDLSWRAVLAQLDAAAPAGVELSAITTTLNSGVAGAEGAQTNALPSMSGRKVIGKLTVTGFGTDKPAIAAYLDALAKLSIVDSPLLTDVIRESEGLRFTAQLNVTTAALGGRFTTNTGADQAGGATGSSGSGGN